MKVIAVLVIKKDDVEKRIYIVDSSEIGAQNTRFKKLTERQCINQNLIIPENLPEIKNGAMFGKTTQVVEVSEKAIIAKNILKKTTGRSFGIDSFIYKVLISKQRI